MLSDCTHIFSVLLRSGRCTTVLIKAVGPKLDKTSRTERRLYSGSFTVCTAYQELLGGLIKKNEMGGVCGMHGGQETSTYGSGA